MKIRQNKMMGYLAVTAGVGCVSSAANAAVVHYGNAGNNNLMGDPVGLAFYTTSGGKYGSEINRMIGGPVFASGAGATTFTRGTDLDGPGALVGGITYHNSVVGLSFGAMLGSANYANLSFNGNDGGYEAVGQFFLSSSGNGYLMAIATRNAIPNPQNLSALRGPTLSISAGKAMIDAAGGVDDFSAVPEPSSLVLLALGATGLAARRQRKKAA